MKTIESALEPITGYLISIKRNTISGWYELEVGIPKNWVYDENDKIKCDVLEQSDTGVLICVSPKKIDIVIDDLISFVEIIIETNHRIAEKEKEFTDTMEKMKSQLEERAKKFYGEIDELREHSFKNLNDNFVKGLEPEKMPRVRKQKPVILTGSTH